MSLRKLEANRHKNTFNLGDWLSAKIYSDVKRNLCGCGGAFKDYAILKRRKGDIRYPVCNQCKLPPEKFRIRANIVNQNGRPGHVFVRHTITGERLSDINDVLGVLNQVDTDLEMGTFDVRKYESKKTRDQYLFKNFAKEYLDFNQKKFERGEITVYGIKGKKKYVKVLMSFFANMDLSKIQVYQIETFKNSFVDKITTRNLALGELRTMLKHAMKFKIIKELPYFGKLEGTGKRIQVLSIEDARKIIPHIPSPVHRMMIYLMTEYAIRPCEVRAIQFRDVSWEENRLYIRRHFSSNKLVDGRKSIKSGKKSSLWFPLVHDFKDYLKELGTPINGEAFVFSSRDNRPVYENTLPEAWSRTLQSLGLPHVQMYEIRHARGNEVIKQSGGNMIAGRDFLGHTTVITTEKHYERSDVDNSRFFKEEEKVISISG